jgi:site-specific DNA recombinase
MKKNQSLSTGSSRLRAVLYARVSSTDQEKEGFSIPAQQRLLRDYAASNGIEIAQEYVDVETARTAGRAQFNEMVTYLKKSRGKVTVILVEKTDRLYRNIKDWSTLDEFGVNIHFVKECKTIGPVRRQLEIPANDN